MQFAVKNLAEDREGVDKKNRAEVHDVAQK